MEWNDWLPGGKIKECIDSYLFRQRIKLMISQIKSIPPTVEEKKRRRETVTLSIRMSKKLKNYIVDYGWEHRKRTNKLVVEALIKYFELNENEYK